MSVRRRSVLLLLLAAVLVAGAAGCRGRSKGKVTIAAASDLTKAFEEVGRAFEKKTGSKPVFRFGSSGLLAQQVGEQAPFDVYAAANIDYVDRLIKNGACHADTKRLYALGRIVVWSRSHRVATLAALAEPRFAKIAISHPDHAPYGLAAKQALQAAGVWDQVKGRVVFGENVRQTMQWAQSGDADAAIVALSLAIVTEGGHSFTVDDKLHAPLVQAIVVCKHGDNTAAGRAFVDFLGTPEGVAIMKRYGFSLPG